MPGWRCSPDRFYLELQRLGRPDEEALHRRGAWRSAARARRAGGRDQRRALPEGRATSSRTRRACASTTARCWPIRARPRRYSPQQYLRTPQEMAALFADVPEALANSVRDRAPLQPGAEARRGAPAALSGARRASRTDEFLRAEAARGPRGAPRGAWRAARGRPSAIASAWRSELDVICQMGFAGYFLIVADFIRWAREQRRAGGPGPRLGRRLAGGLQPRHHRHRPAASYDLLFERFLNPERVSMPDFDIDFCMDGRDRVIEYVAAQVRPRARLADHHLRHHGGQGGGARRRPRARPSLRLRRPHRQADSLRARHHAR